MRNVSAYCDEFFDKSSHPMVRPIFCKLDPTQRSLAIALFTISNIIGVAIGMVVPPLFLVGNHPLAIVQTQF